MSAKTVRNLKKLGITFMSTIMLASIAPTSAVFGNHNSNNNGMLNVNASRRKHHKSRKGRKKGRKKKGTGTLRNRIKKNLRYGKKGRKKPKKVKLNYRGLSTPKYKTYTTKKWVKGKHGHKGHYKTTKHRIKINKKSRKAELNIEAINRRDAELSSGKQTKEKIAQEHQLSEQKQAQIHQLIVSLNQQIDQLRQQQQPYIQDYNKWQDDFKASHGYRNIEKRDQKKEQNDQKHIQQLGENINELEEEIQDLTGESQATKAEEAKEKYIHLLEGNVSRVSYAGHPKYVRISRGSRYFTYWDESQPKKYGSLYVRAGSPRRNPVHKVYVAYNVTLTNGKSYTMYRIASNVATEQDSYWIDSKDTTRASAPHITYHIYTRKPKAWHTYADTMSITPLFDKASAYASPVKNVYPGSVLEITHIYRNGRGNHGNILFDSVRKTYKNRKGNYVPYGRTYYINPGTIDMA